MKSFFLMSLMLFGSTGFCANAGKFSCWFRIGGDQNVQCEETFDLLFSSSGVESVSKRICGLPYTLEIYGDYQDPKQIAVAFHRDAPNGYQADLADMDVSGNQRSFSLSTMDGGLGIQLYCHR